MRKPLIVAALVAASLVAATAAQASLFSASHPALAPLSLKSVYVEGLNASTFAGKAGSSNPLAYDPASTSLMGLRLGDPIPAACPHNVVQPCAAESTTKGAIVAGLQDHVGLGEDLVPGLPSTSGVVEGQALVGKDASGRIDAIVIPMSSHDGADALARVALKSFAGRFGAPTSVSDTQAVWDLPNGVHAKIVYENAVEVPWNGSNTTRMKTLYAALYTSDGASKAKTLLFTDWSVADAKTPS